MLPLSDQPVSKLLFCFSPYVKSKRGGKTTLSEICWININSWARRTGIFQPWTNDDAGGDGDDDDNDDEDDDDDDDDNDDEDVDDDDNHDDNHDDDDDNDDDDNFVTIFQ